MTNNDPGNNHHEEKNRFLKDRFIEAVLKGELGTVDSRGSIVTLKEFKAYFSDIKSQYVASYLPSVTIEPGYHSLSHTKFVFRIGKGVYRLHPGILQQYNK